MVTTLRRNLQPISITFFLVLTGIILCLDYSWIQPVRRLLNNDVVFATPYLLLTLTGVLGYRLNQRRILFGSFFLILATSIAQSSAIWNWVLYFHTTPKGKPSPALFSHLEKSQILTISVPLTLALLFVLKEGRIYSRFGTKFLLATLVPLLLSTVLVKLHWSPIVEALQWRVIPDFSLDNIPDVGVIVLALFAVSRLRLRDRYLKQFHGFVTAGLVNIAFVAEKARSSRLDWAVAFGVCGILWVVAIFRLYWQKVYIDELTGVLNRRALNERLAEIGPNFTVAMSDIDHFKKFNDTYGHDEGDNVLRFVGKFLDNATGGKAYRYGGEEFTIVYENESSADVARSMDQIRKELAAKDFFIRSSKKERKVATAKDRGSTTDKRGTRVQVTVSIGVASSADAPRTKDEVFKAADQALYRAKGNGRNCVVRADPQSD